jgi:activator of HSP90 ATPase
MESLRVTAVFAATPAQLYAAWLNPELHGQMTGAEAGGSAEVGGEFTAWDGYIVARTISLEPDARIVQRWRTSEFADDHPDSLLEVSFTAVQGGTEVTVAHSEITAGASNYEKGWQDFYFTPMQAHFRG